MISAPAAPKAPAPSIRSGIDGGDRKSTRLNSSHLVISYAVFCLKKKIDKRLLILPVLERRDPRHNVSIPGVRHAFVVARLTVMERVTLVVPLQDLVGLATEAALR